MEPEQDIPCVPKNVSRFLVKVFNHVSQVFGQMLIVTVGFLIVFYGTLQMQQVKLAVAEFMEHPNDYIMAFMLLRLAVLTVYFLYNIRIEIPQGRVPVTFEPRLQHFDLRDKIGTGTLIYTITNLMTIAFVSYDLGHRHSFAVGSARWVGLVLWLVIVELGIFCFNTLHIAKLFGIIKIKALRGVAKFRDSRRVAEMRLRVLELVNAKLPPKQRLDIKTVKKLMEDKLEILIKKLDKMEDYKIAELSLDLEAGLSKPDGEEKADDQA